MNEVNTDGRDLLNEIEKEFTTEIKLSPAVESRDVIMSVIKDNERYFPQEIADLSVLKNPGLSLANLREKEISLIKAELAKVEILKLSRIPRWRENELRNHLIAFSQARIYLEGHLSLARGATLLNKITQISKIVSYHSDTPQRPKRRLFPLFGRGE